MSAVGPASRQGGVHRRDHARPVVVAQRSGTGNVRASASTARARPRRRREARSRPHPAAATAAAIARRQRSSESARRQDGTISGDQRSRRASGLPECRSRERIPPRTLRRQAPRDPRRPATAGAAGSCARRQHSALSGISRAPRATGWSRSVAAIRGDPSTPSRPVAFDARSPIRCAPSSCAAAGGSTRRAAAVEVEPVVPRRVLRVSGERTGHVARRTSPRSRPSRAQRSRSSVAGTSANPSHARRHVAQPQQLNRPVKCGASWASAGVMRGCVHPLMHITRASARYRSSAATR